MIFQHFNSVSLTRIGPGQADDVVNPWDGFYRMSMQWGDGGQACDDQSESAGCLAVE